MIPDIDGRPLVKPKRVAKRPRADAERQFRQAIAHIGLERARMILSELERKLLA